MEFFNILGIVTDGLYSLTSTLYTFLGSLYTFIVGLATTNFFNSSTIEEFTRTVYVLAGVFMLFRVAISFLNTLIDPDKLSDKNEGAGNILKRLVIVVLLMVALVPNSFVYRFLDRLELAIIGSDGLIENLVNDADIKSGASTGSVLSKYINDVNPFIGSYRNVEAKVTRCLYKSSVFVDGDKNYKLTIYYGEKCSDAEKYPGLTKIEKDTYYDFTTGTTYTGTYTKPNVTTLEEGDGYNYTTRLNGELTPVAPAAVKIQNKKMILYKDADDCSGNCLTKDVVKTGTEAATNNDMKGKGDSSNSKKSLDVGGRFAQGILNTMASCPEVSEQTSDECMVDIKGNVLSNDKQALSDIDDDKLSISWLVAIIVGIVIIIYLTVLCVEVVVRSLKILLLKMIAPIAIISYVSPKDKVLGQWAKMYASTYLDLFLKLLAIKLGAELISAIKFSGRIIEDLVLILGCLVFMKVIPTMISKIFGIDIASGTLKDSMGMLKAGVGATAGATVGSIVGASTGGKGIGKLTGALRGFGAGAKSGYKGDILTGAKNTSNKNQKINTAKEQGLNFFDRATATLAAKTGMPTKGAAANEKISKVNDVASANKDLKDWAEAEAVKKNTTVSGFEYKDLNGVTRTYGDSIGLSVLQTKLDSLENVDTRGMSDAEFDAHSKKVAETKAILAGAKTAGAAKYIRLNQNDQEVKSRVEAVNNAIAEAKLAGADNIRNKDGETFTFEKINPNNIDADTIKNIKSAAYGMKNAIGEIAEKDIAKERYGNTNS